MRPLANVVAYSLTGIKGSAELPASVWVTFHDLDKPIELSGEPFDKFAEQERSEEFSRKLREAIPWLATKSARHPSG